MAAASGDRPIQNVLGNPNDFNDLYRPPSVKVVFFTIASAKISNTGAILILRIGSAASIPIASHERNLERYKIISRVPPSCTIKQRIRRRLSSQRPPSVVIMAAKNKCLAQMNKSGTAGKTTKKRFSQSMGIEWALIAMTLQEAKSIARHLGLTLRKVRSGDYRVKFRDGNETTAYYTNDLEDAVSAAVERARKRVVSSA